MCEVANKTPERRIASANIDLQTPIRTPVHRSVLVVLVLTFLCLLVFEATKEVLIPSSFTRWQSHWLTICIGTLISTAASFLIMRRFVLLTDELKIATDEELQRLAAVVENSNDFIGIATLDFKPIYINASGCKMVGIEGRNDFRALSIFEFYFPEDQQKLRENIVPAEIATGFWHGEIAMRHFKTGVAIPVEMTGFMVRHPQTQKPMCIATVSRDITERKRVESEMTLLNAHLRQRTADLETALAESEEFAYAAAHNLRSPLRGIDGFAQALLEDCGDRVGKEGREYLGRIRRSAQQQASLIDDLLGLSRLSRTTMDRQSIDLSELAQAVMKELQTNDPERQVDFVVQDHLAANADGQLVRLMLRELLGNAWKFTSNRPRARIEFGTISLAGGQLAFFIRDDGAGFDMAYMDKLFLPFERLHAEAEFPGNGIGLASVKRIVQRHGGKVWAEAAVGLGATFFFTLG